MMRLRIGYEVRGRHKDKERNKGRVRVKYTVYYIPYITYGKS